MIVIIIRNKMITTKVLCIWIYIYIWITGSQSGLKDFLKAGKFRLTFDAQDFLQHPLDMVPKVCLSLLAMESPLPPNKSRGVFPNSSCATVSLETQPLGLS